MPRRFIEDETGMTIGLVVIVIVLIGVMGAGLLTFVQRDLENVVQSNAGQRAFEMTDAGVQLAKQQIRAAPDPELYDVDAAAPPVLGGLPAVEYLTSCNVSDPALNSDWALASGGYEATNLDGDAATTDTVKVTIRSLSKAPTAPSICQVPVLSTGASVRYYKVISTGTFNDAKRKVEAILQTYDNGFPRAFYSDTGIDVSGSATLSGVSLFSDENIEIRGGASITGVDAAYEDWFMNGYNGKSRPINLAGVGTPKDITVSGGGGLSLGTRDFEKDTATKFIHGPNYANPPAGADTSATTPTGGKITFPFNPSEKTQVDLSVMAEIAREQDANPDCPGSGLHYVEVNSTNYTISAAQWPGGDADCPDPVVYVKFPGGSVGNKVTWNVDGSMPLGIGICQGPIREGTIIVENGNFTTSPAGDALFKGIIIVRGGTTIPDGNYSDTGSGTCIQGYANTDGEIKLAGNVTPFSTADVDNTPGINAVKVWSWRELYG